MSLTSSNSEAAILSRIIAPEEPTWSTEAAMSILSLKLSQRDRDRMMDLTEKARRGTLTSDERAESESYERVGSLLGILQSKARASLHKASSTG